VKVIAWLAGIGTLVMGAIYMIISLNRWEWNRALFFGLIVLIAEVGLATGVVLRRITRLEQKLEVDPAVGGIVRANGQQRHQRFAWLQDTMGRPNVFITFLVGGGVIISGIAWMVDRFAGATAGSVVDRKLTDALQVISYPADGLLVDDVTVLAQDVPGTSASQLHKLLRRAGLNS
jgi:hypothetical protein